MALTYRNLAYRIMAIDEDHLDDNVTVYDPETDEYIPVHGYEVQDKDDVLDENHLFLVLDKKG